MPYLITVERAKRTLFRATEGDLPDLEPAERLYFELARKFPDSVVTLYRTENTCRLIAATGPDPVAQVLT